MLVDIHLQEGLTIVAFPMLTIDRTAAQFLTRESTKWVLKRLFLLIP
jgi:hypothetical protein